MKPEQELDDLLKSNFGKFFIVRIEDLILLMKLPVPPNRVTTHTLMYLTEGYITMTIGSEHYTIYKDECLVVAAGQVFSIGNVDIRSGKGYLCSFHNDMIVGKFGKNELLKDFEFLRVWGNPRISLGKETSQFVKPLFRRLLLDYSAHGLNRPDIIQPYFIALLCEINRVYQPISSSQQTKAVQISNQFKELMAEHIKTTHRVREYAVLLNITPNHLSKSVKAITGKSPTKWIDEAIVLEAKVLLYQSKLSVSEVAAEVGLFDPSYFSRLFKKYEGVSPMAFRKMIEKS
jgi:AraC family transcriptional regulator, transcriptional activator of pobA